MEAEPDQPPPVAVPGEVGPAPNVVGREVPVYMVNEGPDPAIIWKRLCIVLLIFAAFLIFMLILKNFSC